MADALEWIVRSNGVEEICHYLDDFLVVGAPGSPQCSESLAALLGCIEFLGFPVAVEKVEGPSSRLTFLGIEIDADALVLRLPGEKLSALKGLIASWRGRRWCIKSELQSLAGKLQHACKVVHPGKSFLRRIFELLKGTHQGHHHIRVNRALRSDLAWWDLFLDAWNGVSLLRPARLSVADQEFYTDASYLGTAIAPKELVPIVMACVVWGQAWRGQVVHVHSDNEAVVAVLNSGYSKDEQLMHLVRCLFFVLAAWDILLYACHIPGVRNSVADAISRDKISSFFSKVPDASPHPTTVPQDLVDLLVTVQPDWTLPSWGRLFRNCLLQV